MPTDLTINSRTLNLVNETANLKVKVRVSGVLKTFTGAEIVANAAGEQAAIQAVMGLGAGTIMTEKTAYVKDAGIVQDTDGNDYPSTYLSGKEIDYATKALNGNIFLDVTP